METMRDAFFNRLFDLAKADSSIMVLTSDFSAPAFDKYRTDLPQQFINTGISEQNTVLVASGLAMSGMKVYVISIAPFITKRCYEQIGLFVADMNLDVTIMGVGAGFSYAEAGATHHSIEDIGLMQMLPHMKILSASDNALVHSFVDRISSEGGPWYVRLDRRSLPDIHADSVNFGRSLAPVSLAPKINFLATGFMTHLAKEICSELAIQGINVGFVDAFSLPLDEDEFEKIFSATEYIISLEEHVAAGGLGETTRRLLSKLGLPVKLQSYALDIHQGFCHTYGQRSTLHERHGIDKHEIIQFIKSNIG